MQMLRTLPLFGLIPLFIIWMGIGETPKIALIAMGVAFPLYLNTLRRDPRRGPQARRGRPDDGPDLARSGSGTSILPGALPQTLVGCARASASPGSR